MYAAKVIADSISPNNHRITTLEVTMPRIVLAEFNTHRMFSRNSASSRAIPVEKRIAMVEADPFIPTQFGKNQKGMQATENLSDDEDKEARAAWMNAIDYAIVCAKRLAKLGVHKQLANRLLEPFCWQTIVVTATDWSNYFALRCSAEAQPEIRIASEMMRIAWTQSQPEFHRFDEWHLPYIQDDDYHLCNSVSRLCKISAARCARVSVLTQDGKRDLEADAMLYEKLVSNGHMSPLEHPAKPSRVGQYIGNFFGWEQLRKGIPFENDFSLMKKG